MHNRFTRQILAVVLAAATAASTVAPSGVYAAESADAGATVAAETEIAVEAEAASASTEETAEESKEEAPVETPAEEEKAEVKQEEDAAPAPEEKKEEPAPEEEAPAAVSEETDKADNGASKQEEKTEAGTTTVAAEEEPAPAAEEEAETKVEKKTFRIRFDEGEGTIKVVFGSDEGADRDNPSVTIEKKDGEKASVRARSEKVDAMIVDNDDYALEASLDQGEKVMVYSEPADSFNVAEYSIETDAGGKKDLDISDDSFILDEDTVLTFKAEKDETKTETGKVYVNLMSDGGTVTITGKEKTYVVSKDEKGNISVTENGNAVSTEDGKYAFAFDAADGEEMTVAAKSNEGIVTAFSIGNEGGSAFEASEFNAEDKPAEFSQKFTVSKDAAKVISVSFADMPEFKGEQKVGNVLIKASAEKGIFPAGVTFKAVDIRDEEHLDILIEALKVGEGYPLYAYDITFYDKSGKEIQPNGMVSVEFHDVEKNEGDAENLAVVHIDEENPEESKKLDTEVKDDAIVIENDKFSPYVVMSYNGGWGSVPNPSNGGSFTGNSPVPSSVTFKSIDEIRYRSANSGYNNDIINHTGVATVSDSNMGGKTTFAFCADPFAPGVDQEDCPTTKTHIAKITTANLIKALYYGNPEYSNVGVSIGGSAAAAKVLTHFAVSYYVKNSGLCSDMDFTRWHNSLDRWVYEAFWQISTEELRDDVAAFMNAVESKPTPSGVTGYIIYPGSSTSSANAQCYVYLVKDEEAYVSVQKVSADESKTNSAYYSKAGATFDVYDTQAHANAGGSAGKIGTLTTDANGKTSALKVGKPGTYWVREVQAPPKGFLLPEDRVKSVAATDKNTQSNPAKVTFSDPFATVSLQITKDPTGLKEGETAPPLKGTTFTVYYDAAHTKEVGKLVVGDDNKTTNVLTKDKSGAVLPLGIYYVVETFTPIEYNKVSDFQINATTQSAAGEAVVKKIQKVDNEVKRIEIKIQKRSSDESVTKTNPKYTLAGAQFGVYTNAQCTGTPIATITTDANGIATTGKTLLVRDYWVKELTPPPAFYINDEDTPKYDKETLSKEITVQKIVEDTPKMDPISLQIKKKAKDFADGENINDLSGTEFTVDFYEGAEYKSKAELSGKTPTRTWVIKAYKATDQGNVAGYYADFKHPSLISGDELYKNEFGQISLPIGTVTIRETKAVKGYINDADFGGGSDIYIANVKLSSKGYVRTTPVVGGTVVSNSSFEVTNPVAPPRIATIAKDVLSESPVSHAGSEVTIEDTVNYENFIVGNEYKIKGRLVDKATGNVIKDIDGKEVTAETTFKAASIDGSVKVTFKFKTDKSFENKTVVAFETAEEYKGGKYVEYVSHANINDEAQTIHFPKVRTNAVNTATGESVVPAEKNVQIKDTITYENLVPGRPYTVKGTVMVKGTNAPLGQEGSEVTATFTPASANGTTEITFTIDARELKNQQLVVFEELYIGTEIDPDKLVGDHKDINDKAQTVAIPDVTTDAADTTIKEKVIINNIEQDGTVSGTKYVDDEVTFSNLEAGKMYEISGELKLQTGESETAWSDAQTVPSEVFAVDTNGAGKLYTEDHKNGYEGDTVYFIPESENGEQFVSGSIIVTFKFDATGCEGKDIVVGETVTRKIKLAIHNDLYDVPQTVRIPKGETMSVDKYTSIKNSLAAENRIFKDTFKYENLEVGKEYVFTGFVVIADIDENGQTVKDENGNPVVHKIDSVMVDENGDPVADGCVKFTPEEENGTIDLYFMIDATEIPNRDVTVFEDVTRLGHNVIRHYVLDGTQTVYIPEGETEAIDSESQDHIAMPDEEVSIIDTLVYKNLIPGKEYTVKGRVMRKDEATEVPSTLTEAAFAEEAQGTEISVKDSVVTFVPQTEDGALKLTFVFDGSELKGEDTVIFERVYHNDSEVIIHENINDEPQTVHLPDGRTEATDPDTDDHTMMAKGDITIRDRFFYENLLPGYEYAVHGKVMLKPAAESEEPTELEAKMVDAEGNEITEWIFTPEQKDGSEDIFFVINADELAGRSVVLFEEMEFINPELETRTVIIRHEDINDEDQTIHFPDGETEALDSETEDHISKADTEVTIYDNLKFKNLIPGKTYTVKGTMMDKATGEPVMINGEPLVVTDEFVPETADGSHIVPFTFDGSLLGGHTIVAFETVYSNGKEVFIHADIEDEDQTVRFPDGGTTATDDKTKDHTTYAEKKAVINDEVVYKNLIEGKEYTVTGVLMDKATGLPLLVNGKQVTASKKFTAAEPDGSIIITFKLDASELAGKSVVAFETVTYKGKEVFVHADLEDADQTIDIPSVKTEAKDKKDGDKTVNPTGTVTVVDKVTYTNLEVGKKYVVTGVLMNKSTKKPAKSGGKDITGQASFTAQEKNGVIEVEFKFNASDLKTGDYVVFEELYEVNAETGENVIVGDHKDINDKAQTIRRPEPPTPHRGARTGDTNMLFIWIAIAAVAIAAAAGIFVVRRRKDN